MKSNILFFCMMLFAYSLFAQGTWHTEAGTHILISDEATLHLDNISLLIEGDLDPGLGTIIVSGVASTTASRIESQGTIHFHNLTIQKEKHDVQLDADIQVANILSMQGGRLDLNGHQIDLGTTAYLLGENEDSYITSLSHSGGEISAKAMLISPQGANPGNLGISIQSDEVLGHTKIIRGHASHDVPQHGQSTYRYVDIIPENNQDLNAVLRFHFLEAELKQLQPQSLSLYHTFDEGITWSNGQLDNRNLTDKWLEVRHVQRMGRWVSAENHHPSSLQASSLGEIKLFPNPTSGALFIHLNAQTEQELTLSIVNILGQEILSRQSSLHPGWNEIKLDLSPLSSGVYLIRFPANSLSEFKVIRE
ncbi:MAG: T9SS type A sorting domain-containing protein [Bacteroidota bacterium]